MQALFALADQGLTALEAAGCSCWSHHHNLAALLGNGATPTVYTPGEQLLGSFKRRFELERGPAGAAGLRILTRLMLNCFAPSFSADAAVEAAVDRSEAVLLGAEALAAAGGEGAALDLVQLSWLDFEVGGHVSAASCTADYWLAWIWHVLPAMETSRHAWDADAAGDSYRYHCVLLCFAVCRSTMCCLWCVLWPR